VLPPAVRRRCAGCVAGCRIQLRPRVRAVRRRSLACRRWLVAGGAEAPAPRAGRAR